MLLIAYNSYKENIFLVYKSKNKACSNLSSIKVVQGFSMTMAHCHGHTKCVRVLHFVLCSSCQCLYHQYNCSCTEQKNLCILHPHCMFLDFILITGHSTGNTCMLSVHVCTFFTKVETISEPLSFCTRKSKLLPLRGP